MALTPVATAPALACSSIIVQSAGSSTHGMLPGVHKKMHECSAASRVLNRSGSSVASLCLWISPDAMSSPGQLLPCSLQTTSHVVPNALKLSRQSGNLEANILLLLSRHAFHGDPRSVI